MYSIIYITNLPSFYKINLLNRIAQQRKILVVFTHETSTQRNNDFYSGTREFEYISLAHKTTLGKIVEIISILKNKSYQSLIVGGWDQLEYWVASFISPRNKNGVVVESSILESKTTGIKGLIKRVFLSRISKAFVSGKSQADLCKAVGFNGELIKTNGVGIFNTKPQPEFTAVSTVKNFIYVGRLSIEKNLLLLIETFNQHPELTLNIVGFGPQEKLLKEKAKQNIIFHGPIPNSELYTYYSKNEVFILPSISEPWGIVVEEALNCGLPVIVSNKVGCADEIVNQGNGIVFSLSDPDGLKSAILTMLNLDYYNSLRLNISKMDFEKIADDQVNCYL